MPPATLSQAFAGYAATGPATLTWSSDGTALAWGASDAQLAVWQTATTTPTLLPGVRTYTAVAWHPNRPLVAAVGTGISVRIWDAQGANVGIGEAQRNALTDLAWSSDGSLLASSSLDSTVALWDAAGDLVTLLDTGSFAAWAIAWHPERQLLAVATGEPAIQLWDPSGQLLLTLGGFAPEDDLQHVAWSPDGSHIAAAAATTARVWSADGTLVATLDGQSPILALQWQPNGAALALARLDMAPELLTVPAVEPALSLGPAQGAALAWSPDGSTFASTTVSGPVVVYDADGAQRLTLEGHSAEVQSLAWSPDGRYLASGSWDGTVRIWRMP